MKVYHVKCTDARLEDRYGEQQEIGAFKPKAVDGSGDIRQILNIKHTSERAQEIALRQLKTFLVASWLSDA